MRHEITKSTLVDALSETLIVVNHKGFIVWTNKSVMNLLNYERNEILGKHLNILIPHDFRDSHTVLFDGFQKQSSKSPMGYSRPLHILTKDNERKEVSIELTPIYFHKKNCVLATITEKQILKGHEHENRLIDDSKIPENLGTWDWNIKTGKINCSDHTFKILGREEIKDSFDLDIMKSFIHPDDKNIVIDSIQKATSSTSPFSISYRIVIPNKSIRYVILHGKTYKNATNNPYKVVGTIQDITEEYEHKVQLRIAESIFKLSYDGAISTNNELEIIKSNPAFERMTGYSASYITGLSLSNIILELKKDSIINLLNKNGVWTGRVNCQSKQKNLFPAHLSIVKITDEMKHGNEFYVATIKDISEIIQQEKELEKLAYYDPLTSLYNRTYFIKKMKEEVNYCKENNHEMSVLFIDLDGFKEVNDSQGHDEGDRVLIDISKTLNNITGKDILLSRFGGDEFVILYKSGIKELIKKLALKILDSLSLSLTYGTQKFKITASIGISIFPKDGKTEQDLLKKSDIAMYRAKELGKNRFLFYKNEFSEDKLYRRQLVSDLEVAIEKRHLTPYFQQIISTNKDNVKRFEALARWFHPNKGSISPEEFIPIAESSNLILEIGNTILKQTCDFIKLWNKEHDSKAIISINLSPHQLFQPNLINEIINIIGTDPKTYKSLIFEITESAIMHDFNKAILILRKLKSLGCSIALDDFGTGYSSLSYLSKLPVDEVKIDRSFVQMLSKNNSDNLICEAIISLSHSLKLNVVAEGVENEFQSETLKKMNCDFLQGFLFSKPMSPNDTLNIGKI